MELRLNVPPQPSEMALDGRVGAAVQRLLHQGRLPDLLDYGSTAGSRKDREAGARWLDARLGRVSADDVVISAGGAVALAGLVTTFAKPKDTVITESLTYPGIRAICRHFGLKLAGVPVDSEGMSPSGLAEACQRTRAKLLYCTPTIQNPTTATMSAGRRAEIAELAEEFDLTIIEDDAYGMLPREAPPPIASLAPEHTYYIASLSKCLSPGLRIAYCVGPREGKSRMTEGIRVVSFLAPPLMVAIASQLIEDGSAIEILEAIRTECSARQRIAREILDGESLAAPPESPHLWISLTGEWKVVELGEYLRSHGVAAKGDGFAVDGVHPSALRIALGAARSREHLIQALRFLKTTLGRPPQAVR